MRRSLWAKNIGWEVLINPDEEIGSPGSSPLFELAARRNHLGLLSEDIDPKTGELWGNYPQTYSLVGLIVCAMRLSKSWEEAFWRGW